MAEANRDVDTSIQTLINIINKRCPKIKPALFPSQTCFTSIQQLCSTDRQIDCVKDWSNSNNYTNITIQNMIFVTDVNYSSRSIVINKIIYSPNEVDALLGSLERVMKMIVKGDKDELMIVVSRFLEVNGYTGEIAEEQHIFYDVYHMAYSVKVALRYVTHIPSDTIID